MNLFALFMTTISATMAQSIISGRIAKSIVNYQGTDYLLRDGCPKPICTGMRDCDRTVSMVSSLYSHCLQSEKGQHVGCITENIGPRQQITLPVYANLCSAMCYETKEANLKKVHECPYEGRRRHDPSFNGLF